MTLKSLVAAAVVLGAVQSGCGGCGDPQPETGLSVVFRAPLDGQTLTANDEMDAAAPGFQHDVVVEVKDTSGGAVELESAKLMVRVADATAFTDGPAAVIDGAKVTFPKATFSARGNVMKVEVVERGGAGRTTSKVASVFVGQENPSLAIVQPGAGEIVGAAMDADPAAAGFQVGFVLSAAGLEGASGTLFCENVCGMQPTAFTVGSGETTAVPVTLTQGACEQLSATCHAVLSTKSGQQLQSASQTFELDTEAPTLEIAEPAAPVASRTFRVAATVGCAETGVVATLSRTGAEALTAPVTHGTVEFPSVTVEQDGTYLYELSVTDKGGNTAVKPVRVVVDSDAPTLVVNVPGTVTADGNASAADGVQATVTVVLNSEAEGAEVSAWPSVGGLLGRRIVATTVQSGADRVASFPVNLAEGANSLRVCTKNAAGVETCTSKAIAVNTGRATCRITNVGYNQALQPSGANPVATVVKVDSTTGPVSLKVLDRTGQEVGTFAASASGGVANVSVQLPQADGEYALVASCPGNGVSQLLPIGIDGTAPGIELSVAGKSDPEIVLGPETADTSVLPGVQVVVGVTTEPWAVVSASITGCASTAAGNGRAGVDGTVTLRGFNVPTVGDCSLNVTAVDNAGNQTSVTRNVKAALVSGSATFVSPAASAVLKAADGTPRSGGGLTVPGVLVNVASPGDGTLKLYVNAGAEPIASMDVRADTADVSFANVELEEGVNVLRAVLTLATGGTSCAVAVVTVDTAAAPVIALTNPGAAMTMHLGIDFGPDEPGIQRPLTYAPAVTVPVDICTDVPVGVSSTPCRGNTAMFTLLKDVPPNTSGFTYPDGKYAIRAVLADGSAQSEAVNLTVDGTRPVVKSVSFQGDANGDRVLTATELPAPQKPVAVVSVDGAEDGRQVTIRDRVSNTVVGGPVALAAGAATVTVGGLSSGGQGSFELEVRVTDAAGNPNNTTQARPFDPVNTEALVSLKVDQAPPTATVSNPTKPVLGPADDGNMSTPAFDLRLVVAVPADAVKVTIDRTAPVADGSGDLTPQNLSASWDFPVAAGSSATHVFTITVTDSVGNVTQVPYSVVVDLEAPVVAISAPANGSSHSQSQVPVTLAVTGASNGSAVVTTRLLPGTQTYTLDSSFALDATGAGTKTLYFPNGLQEVTATVTDAAGNTGSAAVQITVASPGCTILVTQPSANPALLSGANDSDGNASNGLQTAIAGSSPNCTGTAVTLKKGGTNVDTVTSGATNGAFSFNISLNDAETATYTLEMTDAFSQTSSLNRTITADLTPPAIANVSPAGGPLYFVAAANEHLFPAPAAGYVQDKAPGGDAEFDLSFLATGADQGTATVEYRGTPIATQPVDAASKTVSFLNLALAHNTAGALRVVLADKAGNTAAYSVNATVDVVPPAAPTVTRTLTNARAATVDLSWTSSGDDGTTGTVAGYEARWTTDLVVPGGITSDATYFDAAKTKAVSAPASSTSLQLTGLPPINTYYVHVRAKDDVGNYSPFVQAGAAVANPLAPFTLSNPGSGNAFGYASAVGDLNGGGKSDLVVSAPSGTPGVVYIYYGENGLAAGAPQELSASAASDWFGSAVAVGNVGDAAGENRPDLLVGSITWNPGTQPNRGRAFLYFGQDQANVDAVSYVEFRGTAGAGTTYFGRQVAAINDIDGDGLAEVVISAPNEASARGRVYMWYGRTKSAWLAARSGNEGGTLFVPTSSADRVFEGDATISQLGRNWGFVSLGDVNGDGTSDFTVPAALENSQKVYIYSGATVVAKSGALLESDALQTLSAAASTSTNINGFGTAAVGGRHFVGGPEADLVISRPVSANIYFYAGGVPPAFSASPAFTITETLPRRLGYSLAAADFTGDGRPDMAAGESWAPGGAAYLFFHRGEVGAEYDRFTDTGLHQSRVVGNSLGTSVAFGDYDGDGKQDIAIGDRNANSVTVWY